MARPDGVEQPHDDDREFLFFPVRQREELVERLGSCIAPAAFGGGAKDEVGFFVKRHLRALAIYLRGGRGKNELTFFAGGFEDQLRAVDVGLDGADGAFDDEFDADSGSEMNDDIGIVDELG